MAVEELGQEQGKIQTFIHKVMTLGKPGGKYGGDKSREGFDSKTREVKLNTPSEYTGSS